MLSVGDRVANDILKEDLEDAASLLVDEAADALDAASAGQAADGRLRDTLDVIPEDLAMPLGPAFSQSLASLASSRHLRFFLSRSRFGREVVVRCAYFLYEGITTEIL